MSGGSDRSDGSSGSGGAGGPGGDAGGTGRPDGDADRTDAGGGGPRAGAGDATGPGEEPRADPDPGDERRHPRDAAALLREHAPFVTVVVLIEGALAWLATTAGASNLVLLTVVPVVAVGYKAILGADRLGRDTRETLVTLLFLGGLFVFLGSLSNWSAGHLVLVSVTVGVYALFALGLNLEFGYTGIINFGHVAFLGIGAYVTALLSKRWLPAAAELTRPSALGFGMIVASAVLAFLVVGVIASALAGSAVRRWSGSGSGGRRRRVSAAAGGTAGTAAAVALVWTVSFPLEPHWASAFVIGAAVLVGMFAAAGFGVLLGLPTLRLRADYLAIVTIGAAEIVRRMWLNEGWLTNGPQGITGFALPLSGEPQTFSFPMPLTQARTQWEPLMAVGQALGLPDAYKLLLLVMVGLAIVLAYALYEILVRSPYGRVLKAIREDEEVAGSLGKNVFAYKLQALALGSALAALAGAFLAWDNVFISPQSFIPEVTFFAWIIIVLGGVGNNKGTIVGAMILWTLFQTTNFLRLEPALGITSGQAAALEIVLVGVLLIAFMMFKPEGLLGRREEMVLGE